MEVRALVCVKTIIFLATLSGARATSFPGSFHPQEKRENDLGRRSGARDDDAKSYVKYGR